MKARRARNSMPACTLVRFRSQPSIELGRKLFHPPKGKKETIFVAYGCSLAANVGCATDWLGEKSGWKHGQQEMVLIRVLLVQTLFHVPKYPRVQRVFWEGGTVGTILTLVLGRPSGEICSSDSIQNPPYPLSGDCSRAYPSYLMSL